MQKLLLFIVVIILSNGDTYAQKKMMNSADNKLSQKEKADGWKLLFDGKTANGWHRYGKQDAGKAWSVKDGAFYLDAEEKKKLGDDAGGDLVTNEEYDNFDLKLDWKIGFKGNSGIIIVLGC